MPRHPLPTPAWPLPACSPGHEWNHPDGRAPGEAGPAISKGQETGSARWAFNTGFVVSLDSPAYGNLFHPTAACSRETRKEQIGQPNRSAAADGTLLAKSELARELRLLVRALPHPR